MPARVAAGAVARRHREQRHVRTLCDHPAARGGARLFRLRRDAEFSAALQHRADPADSRGARRTAQRGRRGISAHALGLPAGLRQGPEGLPAHHQRPRRDARREAELPRRPQAATVPGHRRRFLRMAEGARAGRARRGKRPYLIRRVERRADGVRRPLRDLERSERRRDRHRLHRHHRGQRACGASCTTACRRSSSRATSPPGSTSTGSRPRRRSRS